MSLQYYQKIFSFLTIASTVLCQDFSVDDLNEETREFRDLKENTKVLRYIDIFTNHPNARDVENTYYQLHHSPKSVQNFAHDHSLNIDRRDTFNFNNIEDVFASPPRYNLESEYGEFDQNFGGTSVVNYYAKPDGDHKNPTGVNHFDTDKSYVPFKSQKLPDNKNAKIDIRNKNTPYFVTNNRRNNISNFIDFDAYKEPELTTKYSDVQKIAKYPDISRYLETVHPADSSDKYEEIPILTVAKNQNTTPPTRNKIADVLRHYLIKLYKKKYLNADENLESNEKNLDESYTSQPKQKLPKLDDSESKLLTVDTLTYLKNKTLSKINKFLSIFTVVKFNNTECNATTLYGTWQGLCYTAAECAHMGGISFDACAGGYGICCVFRGTCGDWSSRNCTYFKSPNYPDYYPPGGGVIVPTTTSTTPTAGTPDPRLHWYYNSEILEDSKKRPSGFLDFDSKYAPHDIVSKSLENTRNGLNDPEADVLMSRQNADTMSCIYSVYKSNPNVKQMRIDFIDLELAGPTNGTCQTERLVITGQNTNNPIPVICGYNTGQHIYVDVSQLNGPLQLMVLSTTGAKKRFKIRVCQYDDSCEMPNSNCLQYYTGAVGVIQSFNYDQASMLNRSSPGYFNNLNYAICIRREAGYCSITFSNVQNGVTYPFQLVNLDNSGMPTIPRGQAGVDIINCPDDYLVIDGTRLCGERFNDGSTVMDFTRNAAVTDTSAGPIIVTVRTDSDTTGLGFKLFYTQNRCTTTSNTNTPNPRS